MTTPCVPQPLRGGGGKKAVGGEKIAITIYILAVHYYYTTYCYTLVYARFSREYCCKNTPSSREGLLQYHRKLEKKTHSTTKKNVDIVFGIAGLISKSTLI